jgi:hypothetical protein
MDTTQASTSSNSQGSKEERRASLRHQFALLNRACETVDPSLNRKSSPKSRRREEEVLQHAINLLSQISNDGFEAASCSESHMQLMPSATSQQEIAGSDESKITLSSSRLSDIEHLKNNVTKHHNKKHVSRRAGRKSHSGSTGVSRSRELKDQDPKQLLYTQHCDHALESRAVTHETSNESACADGLLEQQPHGQQYTESDEFCASGSPTFTSPAPAAQRYDASKSSKAIGAPVTVTQESLPAGLGAQANHLRFGLQLGLSTNSQLQDIVGTSNGVASSSRERPPFQEIEVSSSGQSLSESRRAKFNSASSSDAASTRN